MLYSLKDVKIIKAFSTIAGGTPKVIVGVVNGLVIVAEVTVHSLNGRTYIDHDDVHFRSKDSKHARKEAKEFFQEHVKTLISYIKSA